MLDFEGELGKAVKHFWQVRGKQRKRQGGKSGKKDAGERGSGGKHADGFIRLIAAIVKDAALPNIEIHVTEKKPRTLPGFYRPCKEWDLIVEFFDRSAYRSLPQSVSTFPRRSGFLPAASKPKLQIGKKTCPTLACSKLIMYTAKARGAKGTGTAVHSR
jgi:hypothetical protein